MPLERARLAGCWQKALCCLILKRELKSIWWVFFFKQLKWRAQLQRIKQRSTETAPEHPRRQRMTLLTLVRPARHTELQKSSALSTREHFSLWLFSSQKRSTVVAWQGNKTVLPEGTSMSSQISPHWHRWALSQAHKRMNSTSRFSMKILPHFCPWAGLLWGAPFLAGADEYLLSWAGIRIAGTCLDPKKPCLISKYYPNLWRRRRKKKVKNSNLPLL